MSDEKRELDVPKKEIVATLLDTGAVNFDAIGAALARYGPELALYGEPGWDGDNFCGTMRTFIHLYHLPGTFPGTKAGVGELGPLRGVGEELGG